MDATAPHGRCPYCSRALTGNRIGDHYDHVRCRQDDLRRRIQEAEQRGAPGSELRSLRYSLELSLRVD